MNTALRLGGLLAGASLLGACSASVPGLDCDEIADQAKGASANQAVQIGEVRNVTEQSRSGREARCIGEATWSDQSVSNVHLRAYESENGSVMIEYSNQPYTEPARQ